MNTLARLLLLAYSSESATTESPNLMPFYWAASSSTFWQNFPSSRHSVRPFPHRSHHVSCVYYFRDNLPVCFPIKVPIHRFSSLAYVCIGSFRDKQRISGLVMHFCHVCVFTRFVSSLNALQRLHVYCICTFSAMSTTYILCAFLSKATLFPSRGKFLMSMRPYLL